MSFSAGHCLDADLRVFVALYHLLLHTSSGGGKLLKDQRSQHQIKTTCRQFVERFDWMIMFKVLSWIVTILQEMLHQLHLFAFSFPLCLKLWLFSQPAHLSSRPTGVPTTQRSPITAQTFTPSLCGQPVKDFCVQALFFSFLLFFSTTLHGATWAWSRWKDCSGGEVSKQQREWELEEAMYRVRRPSNNAWWTEPLINTKSFFNFAWAPERPSNQTGQPWGETSTHHPSSDGQKPAQDVESKRNKERVRGEEGSSTDES